MKKITWIFLFLLWAGNANATIWHVRTDGGTRQECTGQVDAPASGFGLKQPCAFNNPLWATGIVSSSSLKSLLVSGDRILIHKGEYKIGYDVQFAEYCGINSTFDCRPRSLPAGTPEAFTEVVGESSGEGCIDPPVLFGVENVNAILDLRGSSFTKVSCLELTDHSSCRVGGPATNRCNQGPFPKGPYAQNGIIVTGATGVTLTDVNIHGMGLYGLYTSKLTDFTFNRGKINGSGQAGWHGEYVQGNSSNSGKIVFRDGEIRWNGCAENYPEKTSPVPGSCCSQGQRCYNDGIGMADSGGDYLIENSDISFNAEDGIDLLHVTKDPPTSVTIRGNRIEGNAGNGAKTGATNVLVENNKILSGCVFLESSDLTAVGWQMGDNSCRGGGEPLGMEIQGRTHHIVTGNTILQTVKGKNVSIFGKAPGAVCLGTEDVTFSKNLIVGGNYLNYNDVRDCAGWGPASYQFLSNVVYKVSSGCPAGEGNVCAGEKVAGLDALLTYSQGMAVPSPNDGLPEATPTPSPPPSPEPTETPAPVDSCQEKLDNLKNSLLEKIKLFLLTL